MGADRRTGRSLNYLRGIPVAVLALFLGCSTRPTEPDLQIQPDIAHPVHVGSVNIAFRLSDSAFRPITGARISVEGDMSHAGMAPVFGEAKEAEPGRYQAQLNLDMAGDWVVLLHIVMPSGEKVERQIDLKGVRPS